MQAMGPEAALLRPRFAELRATQVYRDLEMPRESPIYVEASVRSQLREFLGPDRYSPRHGTWTRFWAALRLRPDRTVRETGIVGSQPLRAMLHDAVERLPSISAAPIASFAPVDPPKAPSEASASLASLPLRWAHQR